MNSDNLFNLSDDEIAIVKAKNGNKNKLGFAILLKYFQLDAYIKYLMLTIN